MIPGAFGDTGEYGGYPWTAPGSAMVSNGGLRRLLGVCSLRFGRRLGMDAGLDLLRAVRQRHSGDDAHRAPQAARLDGGTGEDAASRYQTVRQTILRHLSSADAAAACGRGLRLSLSRADYARSEE